MASPRRSGVTVSKNCSRKFASEGWGTERNVHGPGEEQDLVLHRDLAYYLAESKWVADSVEASEIREFHSRVTARAGVRGLFFSVSGFSTGAVREAEDRFESGVILFFGPSDVETMITGEKSFTGLLEEKLHTAITRRKVTFL